MADTFLGQSITDMVNQTDQRYFYGLRRTDDGELFIAKVDQLSANDSIQINNEGDKNQDILMSHTDLKSHFGSNFSKDR